MSRDWWYLHVQCNFYIQDVSAEALDQLDKENEQEKLQLMVTIEVEKKEAEQQVIRQYMSHFLLGMKV